MCGDQTRGQVGDSGDQQIGRWFQRLTGDRWKGSVSQGPQVLVLHSIGIGQEHYISRLIHIKPGSYLAHDAIAHELIYLGLWFGLNKY
jgi:hypothetical protein